MGSVLTVKVWRYVDGAEIPFEYENTFVREVLQGGVERLKVGLRGGHAAALRLLGSVLAPPYRLLYVLHTSRAPLGRYESPDLDGPEVEAVVDRFGRFFAEDPRHDVWLFSAPDEATVILDRYNMLYAYGPLDRIAQFLAESGVREVARWAAPEVPYPHVLHYYAAWDPSERELLAALAWTRKPLRPEDVQFWSGPSAS